ncbi:hypothetical protein DMTZ50_0492 [Dehalococcoides mccartyi]|nr:hypothetical protein [Dehalococcoides mccartyi]
MYKRRTQNRLTQKWSNLKKESRGTLISGLGFVPGLGTVLNIRDTAIRAKRTARAGKELADEIRRNLGE